MSAATGGIGMGETLLDRNGCRQRHDVLVWEKNSWVGMDVGSDTRYWYEKNAPG
ncbi:hypothetical protein DPMN_060595 [Dreissena polymorpha]|uniref:Uncharacterized protein n=1 Tax=Dreissena polymorpha TaxID=45954 RepID=A0A9D4HHN0_DREPO|nr:hypothetical protein DPMN_060595 [Dreissena polymorpha]